MTEELYDNVETLKEYEVRGNSMLLFIFSREGNSASIPFQPTLESLESEYDSKHEEYETKKKEMIGEAVHGCMCSLIHNIDPILLHSELKNKRSGLEDACQRLQRDLSKMHIPQVSSV